MFFCLKKYLLIFLYAITIGSPLYPMETTFFNVGQGNCALVSCPGQPSLLNDAGSLMFPTNSSGQAIKRETIAHIIHTIEQRTPNKQLTIVVSHADKDHCIWIPTIASGLLKKDFSINFILGGKSEDYTIKIPKEENPYPQEKHIKMHEVLPYFQRDYPQKCTFQYIGAIEGDNIQDAVSHLLPSYCKILHAQKTAPPKKRNDTSIVLKVEHENNSVLLPGDATGTIINKIIAKNPHALESKILMVNHHGSEKEKCTTEKSLALTKPEKLIFSSSLYTSYHHPAAATVQLAKEYCDRAAVLKTTPHTFTHSRTAIQPYQSDRAPDANFRTLTHYNNGFSTSVTTYPLFNTTDSGTITCDAQETTYLEHGDTIGTDFKFLLLKIPNDSCFSQITSLVLSHLNLTSIDIKTKFKALPPSLEYLDLRDNKIGARGFTHLIDLLGTKTKNLLIKLSNNLHIKPRTLPIIKALPALSALKDKNQIDIQSYQNGTKAFLQNIKISENTMPSAQKQLTSRYYQIPFYDYHKQVMRNTLTTRTLDGKLIVTYENGLIKLWDLDVWDQNNPANNNATIVVENFDSVDAFCFSGDNTILAIVCQNSTYLWDLYKGGSCITIPGTLASNDNHFCWKYGDIIDAMHKDENKTYIPVYNPFSANNKYLAMIGKEKSNIVIWKIDYESSSATRFRDFSIDVSKKNTKVECVSFTDSDRSIRIDYNDNTHTEYPLVMPVISNN